MTTDKYDGIAHLNRPTIEGDTVAKQTLPTWALLACGAVAGPLYVTVLK